MAIRRSPGCNCCSSVGCSVVGTTFDAGADPAEYADFEVYGAGWDALSDASKQVHVSNKTIPTGSGVMSRADLIPDSSQWVVEMVTLGNPDDLWIPPQSAGLKVLLQADGPDPSECYYLEQRTTAALPRYSPDYNGMDQGWEDPPFNYVSGIRSGGTDTDWDNGYPIFKNFILGSFVWSPYPCIFARQKQPTGCWLNLPVSSGLGIPDTVQAINMAWYADQAGVVLPSLGNGGFDLAVGDLLVYRGSTQEERFDFNSYDHYLAGTLPADQDVLTFFAASTKLIEPADSLTGRKVGMYNDTGSNLVLPQAIRTQRSRSVNAGTQYCENVSPVSVYCHGSDNERTLPSINYTSDNSVANAVVNNYLQVLPNDQTLHDLGSHNARYGVRSYDVVRIYIHSSKQDVFGQNGTDYNLKASWIWEWSSAALGEAKGLATYISTEGRLAICKCLQGSTTHTSDADRTTYLNGLIANAVEYSWNYVNGAWSSFPTNIAATGGVLSLPSIAVDFNDYDCSTGGWVITQEYGEDLTGGIPLATNPVVGLSWTIEQ